MKQKLAHLISVLGHPFITIPIFVFVAMFSNENMGKAVLISSLVVGCIFLPLFLLMFFKSRNGSYTNMDVSDRRQRKSVFNVAFILVLGATLVCFITHQPIGICISMLFATILTFSLMIVNLFIKSSLHVALTIYLAFLTLSFNWMIAIMFIIISVFIGWSRIELQRHTKKEVLIGGLIGLIIGSLMYYFKN